MRNAFHLSTLAECCRPGFARHRALSRRSQWTIIGSAQRSEQSNQTATSPEPNADDAGAGSAASSRGLWKAASNLRPGERRARNPADNGHGAKLDGDWELSKRELDMWASSSTRTADEQRMLKESLSWWSPTNRLRNYTVVANMMETSPTEVIYQRMRFSASRGEAARVWQMASYLLSNRGEQPNLRLYGSLILSQCGAASGSAHWVESLLAELREEGLELDSGVCHDVLKVLAIHPNFLLRNEILAHMRTRWYTPSPDGRHDVAAGLIRDGQLELAVEAIDDMAEAGITVQTWLLDVALHVLCEAGEVDQALHILKSRVDSDELHISPSIWFRVLDICSEARHYNGASFVWKRRVQQDFLNPPSGVCLNILKLAALHADVDLAIDVFRVLGQRSGILQEEHYELLMHAYIRTFDFTNAFNLLCIMHDNGTEPDLGTVRTLVLSLRSSTPRRTRAFEALQELSKERKVPIATVNAFIDAASASNNLDEMVEYYKCMHDICTSPGRNVDTFNLLLRGCAAAGRKDVAMFVAGEMVAMGIEPNALTYERLILTCLKDSSYEDAIRYYFEMRDQGFRLTLRALFTLTRRAARRSDSRVRILLDDMATYGLMAERPRFIVENIIRDVREGEDPLAGPSQEVVSAAN